MVVVIVSTTLATIVAAGCSANGVNAPSTTPPPTSATVVGTVTSTLAGASSSVAPEPTGVPGLDDGNPFCAAWAAYSGTLQAIGVADAFGQLASTDLARLELVAAAALADAVVGIGSRWPNELVAERTVVLGDLVGPYQRRAGRALAALRAAGVTDEEIDELRTIWLVALHERNPDVPVLAVPPMRAELDEKVRAAAAAFDAAVTPFVDDPSLQVDSIATPLTDAYLTTTCPDLASSGVGDTM